LQKYSVTVFLFFFLQHFHFCDRVQDTVYVHSHYKIMFWNWFQAFFWQKATDIVMGWSKGHMCNNHSMHYTESPKLCNFCSIHVICACPAGCTPLLYHKYVHKYDPSGQYIAETLPLSWTTGLKVLQMCQGICWPY